MPVVKCDKCGKEFEVKDRTFKEKKYSSNPNQWLCRSCKLIGTGSEKKSIAIKNRWKNATDEQRKQWTSGLDSKNYSKEKMHDKIEKQKQSWRNMDPEKRKSMLKKKSDNKKQWYKETDPEYIADMNKRSAASIKKYFAEHPEVGEHLSKVRKEWWKNMTDDQRAYMKSCAAKAWGDASEEQRDRMRSLARERGIRLWKDRDPETKSKMIERLLQSQKEYWNSLSDEERSAWMHNVQKGHDTWYNSLTDEELINLNQRRSIAMKDVWKNRTPEELEAISKIHREIAIERWKNMTEDEFNDWQLKRAAGLSEYVNNLHNRINKNEESLINLLRLFELDSSSHFVSEIKHPDFDKLFPFNPVTGSTNVSYCHEWDVIVHTKNKPILIDIDGSIHDPDKINHSIKYFDGKIVSLKDLIAFNDSKRPYQTDGLDAYVIKCYDDNLTLRTPVVNITNGESISVFDMIKIIKANNLTDNEIKESINEL